MYTCGVLCKCSVMCDCVMCDGVMWDTLSSWSFTDGGGGIGQSLSGLVTIEYTKATWREVGREGVSEYASE